MSSVLALMSRQFEASSDGSGEAEFVSVSFERPEGTYGVAVYRDQYCDTWVIRNAEQKRLYPDDRHVFEKVAEKVMANWMPPRPRPRAAIELLTRSGDFKYAMIPFSSPDGKIEKDFESEGWRWHLHRSENARYLRFYFLDNRED